MMKTTAELAAELGVKPDRLRYVIVSRRIDASQIVCGNLLFDEPTARRIKAALAETKRRGRKARVVTAATATS